MPPMTKAKSQRLEDGSQNGTAAKDDLSVGGKSDRIWA
jgi:hypothetical protein